MKELIVALLTALILLAMRVWCVQVFWESAIPAMFPGLVTSGALAAKISFWNSLVAIWLVESILPQRSQKKAE